MTSDQQRHEMRIGDTVKHRPTGETWVIAWIDQFHRDMAWMGWPEGRAALSECDLVKACTDDEHRAAVREIASSTAVGDFRVVAAKRTLLWWRALEAMGLARNDPGRWGLGFALLRVINTARCELVFHRLEDWSPTDWACAMAGEAGELCNLVKKIRRGEEVSADDLGRELADVVIYADLCAARLGIDLGLAVARKFNEVSLKRKSNLMLPIAAAPEVNRDRDAAAGGPAA